MFNKVLNYYALITIHIGFAIVVFIFPFSAKIFGLLIFFFGIIYINNAKNKNHEALVVCGYVVGSEVFMRATGGAFFYEYAKYGVILLLLLGMWYKGSANNVIPYWLYLVFLVPSAILAVFFMDITSDDRKIVSNSLSGPLCLGVSALYCYRRKISFATMQNIISAIGLPIISLVTFLVIFNPNVKEVVTSTESNFATSGGYGPNQVSTALGLGIFIFIFKVLLDSKNKLLVFTNLIIAALLAYRGVLTFSRGGVFTGIAMLAVLLLNLFYFSNRKTKAKLTIYIAILCFCAAAIWAYSSSQTDGLINKRYNNQDTSGKVNESNLSGREVIIENEWNIFLDNPILGAGVGQSYKIRQKQLGFEVASHSEIGRLLAEHGILGIFMLLILILTPIFLFFKNAKNFLLLPFLIFWGLTINHAAMRTAAPGFIYALALLNINFKPNLRIKKITETQELPTN